MDDLIDRLVVLSPAPAREPDLAFVRSRARRRRRRRTSVLGVAGIASVVLVAVAGLGISRVLSDGSSPERIIQAASPDRIPADWGGPISLVSGTDALYVVFDVRVEGVPGTRGLARLDPVTGQVRPLRTLPEDGVIAYGGGSLWLSEPTAGRLTQLDVSTGDAVATVEVPDGLGNALLASDDAVWLLGWTGLVRVDIATMTAQTVGDLAIGPQFTEPVLVDDTLWIGQDHGLLRVSADGTVDRFDGPETGARIYALAVDGDQLWVGSSPSADAPSTIGLLDRSTDDLSAALASPTVLPGVVQEIAIVGDTMCIQLESSAGAFAPCGALRRDRPMVFERLSEGDVLDGLDSFRWVSVDGELWGTRWSEGIVRSFDPATLESDVVLDLPFDASALQQRQYERIGDEIEVDAGRFPGGVGRWTLVAYETRAGICVGVRTGIGMGGGCDGPGQPLPLSLTTSDGSGDSGEPPWVVATVTADVARIRVVLDDGETIERKAIDVGLPVKFAMAVLPAGTRADRVEALDADGDLIWTDPGMVP
jgi:hypothetical protein